jgi:phosphoribosylanthranilate isomerase
MRDKQNVNDVAALSPDYMGFIFYPESKRFVGDKFQIPLSDEQRKSIYCVGVFVNQEVSEVYNAAARNVLDVIQLHGGETPEYCETLKNLLPKAKIWKAFNVDVDFKFESLEQYDDICDAFLFDSKSEGFGGSGKSFDWQILKNYKLDVPFILAGGIGLDEAKRAIEWERLGLPLLAIDINSKVESSIAIKSISKLQEIINLIRK